MMELEEQIAEMPATSIAEMVAKARCARASDENCYPDCDDRLSIFSASIVRGLASMFGMNKPGPDMPFTLRAKRSLISDFP
jgi:hypothetical protein